MASRRNGHTDPAMMGVLEEQVLQLISDSWIVSVYGGFRLDEKGWATIRAYGVKRSEAEAVIKTLWDKGIITISVEKGHRVLRVAQPTRIESVADTEEWINELIAEMH